MFMGGSRATPFVLAGNRRNLFVQPVQLWERVSPLDPSLIPCIYSLGFSCRFSFSLRLLSPQKNVQLQVGIFCGIHFRFCLVRYNHGFKFEAARMVLSVCAGCTVDAV